MPSGPIKQVVLKTTPFHLASTSRKVPVWMKMSRSTSLHHITIGVLVRDRHTQAVDQLVDRRVNRRRVGELRENNQLDIEEWLIAHDGAIRHPEQSRHTLSQLAPVAQARQISLAGRSVISRN